MAGAGQLLDSPRGALTLAAATAAELALATTAAVAGRAALLSRASAASLQPAAFAPRVGRFGRRQNFGKRRRPRVQHRVVVFVERHVEDHIVAKELSARIWKTPLLDAAHW